jgi:hypothetical protein
MLARRSSFESNSARAWALRGIPLHDASITSAQK